jgi:uncharacterized protein
VALPDTQPNRILTQPFGWVFFLLAGLISSRAEHYLPSIAIGVISDTHGLLRPEAVAALRGSDRIIHAGDIGSPEILDELRLVAPVTVVRGNVDRDPWAEPIPWTEAVKVGNTVLYVLHDLRALDLNPRIAEFAAVISGHTHQPTQKRREGVLYFNPGSAGPRRFRLPVSLGKLTVRGTTVKGELIRLEI